MSRMIKLSGLKGETITVRVCDRFWTKFLGLMFQKKIETKEGILIQSDQESILNSSIHMFFMNFPISVFWINRSFQIIDKTIANPWRPAYFPKSPAMFILETHPTHINTFEIGEQLFTSNA